MKSTPQNTREHRIRVLLLSKYPIVQESLKLLIDSSQDLTVSCIHSSSDDVDQLDCVTKSDVAVVYFTADDRAELIPELLKKSAGLRIVVIAEGLDVEMQAHLFKIGAFGIVQKEQGPERLLEAIRRTHSGETWLSQAVLNKILGNGKSKGRKLKKGIAVANGESLTARELEIISVIGEGLKNKDIGERLLISEATVRHHLSSIYGKVGVEDRLNLVIFAFERGIIQVKDEPGDSQQ